MEPPTLDPKPVTAYIGLGANLGDRLASLRRAVILLDAAASAAPNPASPPPQARESLRAPNQDPPKNLVVSSLYETDPVGGPSGQPMYLNAVAQILTRLPARELLRKLLDIEASLGRTRSARNESRIIDLDLLLHGEEQTAEPDVIIPHPGIAQRRFVLEPLAELAPDLCHPLLGQTILQLAIQARRGTSQGVRRIGHADWLNPEHPADGLDDESRIA